MKKIMLFVLPLFSFNHIMPMEYLGKTLFQQLAESGEGMSESIYAGAVQSMMSLAKGATESAATSASGGLLSYIPTSLIPTKEKVALEFTTMAIGIGISRIHTYFEEKKVEAIEEQKRLHEELRKAKENERNASDIIGIINREYKLLFGVVAPDRLDNLTFSELSALAIAEESAAFNGRTRSDYFRAKLRASSEIREESKQESEEIDYC